MARAANPKHRPAEPLSTRHLFLDTQVYRELRHNPANPALAALKQHIDAHRIVLHTTDITMAEVRRQIRERVLSHARELALIEKDFRRWRRQAPDSMPPEPLGFDAEATAAELFATFERFITVECGAYIHSAMEADAKLAFASYFERKAPFDGADSKEFPDAFVLQTLSSWAALEQDTMHVVTLDGAMTRAADADPTLRTIKSIQEALARAGVALGGEAEAEAEAILLGPAIDASLERLLQAQMPEAVFIYTGDQLPEGYAYGGELLEIEAVTHWSVISLTEMRLVLLLDARVQVRVEIQYEDRTTAFFDREDDRWYGGEDVSTEIEDTVEIELFVEVSRISGEVVGCKILTSEIRISDPSDHSY